MSEVSPSSHPTFIVDLDCHQLIDDLDIKTDKITNILQENGLPSEEIETTTIHIQRGPNPRHPRILDEYDPETKTLRIFSLPIVDRAHARGHEKFKRREIFINSDDEEFKAKILAVLSAVQSSQKMLYASEFASCLMSIALRSSLEERIMHFERSVFEKKAKRDLFLNFASRLVGFNSLIFYISSEMIHRSYLSETTSRISALALMGATDLALIAKAIKKKRHYEVAARKRGYADSFDRERSAQAEETVQWDKPLIRIQVEEFGVHLG